MARSKNATRKGAPRKLPPHVPVVPEPEVLTYTVPELLLHAAQFISASEFDDARNSCLEAVKLADKEQDSKGMCETLEMLGMVQLELGELEEAREHFLLAIEHGEAIPDPSPAPHLYLAQLSSPEESLSHFASALTILQAKLAVIEHAKLGADGGAGTELEAEDEGELRRSASRALVGMTELYLTDLCDEPLAEETCEVHLALAMALDPSDPEVYQTLASVRLSQERPEDAKTAALKSWSCWKTLAPESPQYPASTTRLSLARLFLEVSLYASALEILQRLENEDDEDGDIWYLSGWAWWLLGEERAGAPPAADVETKDECWSEGKLCLENYLRLDAREEDGFEEEQLAHVRELMEKLDAAGVVASEGHKEGGADWEDSEEEEDDAAMEE